MTREAYQTIVTQLSPEVGLSYRPEHDLIAKALHEMFMDAQKRGLEPHQFGPIRISNSNSKKGSPKYIACATVKTMVVGFSEAEEKL